MLVRFDYPKTYDSMIEDLFSTDCMPARSTYPVMDVVEKENETFVVAELPGVKKEEIKITFENNVLTISGSRKPNEFDEKANLVLHELRSGDFSRSVKFGNDVDTTKMSAEMNNGILTITLPKAESVKARVININ